VELPSQLKTECADRKKIEAELCELRQNSAPVARLFKKLTLRLVIILTPLRAREKLKTGLGNLKAILQILES
jgi:hypothetical protein